MPMAGIRAPQPPPPPSTSVPDACSFSRRRRHSLPALSSEELNQLSANANKSRGQRCSKKSTKPSLEKSPKTAPKPASEKVTPGMRSNARNLPQKAKGVVPKESKDEALEDNNIDETLYTGDINRVTEEDVQRSSPSILNNGSSTLQSKVQSSKGNAVFIFRFDDDEEKVKDYSKDSASKSPPSPVNQVVESETFSQPQLSQTWPFNSVEDRNSFNLLKNSVRYNTLGFCGFKHRQFRENGKLHKTMTPVLELKTPTDETEYESEDEGSFDSTSDYWTDSKSSNGTNSPMQYRVRDLNRRKTGPVKIDANSNLHLSVEHNARYSNLRSALSLSPRRSTDKHSLSALREFSQRQDRPTLSANQSLQRRTVRRGSLDSKVGQIFNTLKTSPSSPRPNATSKSLSSPQTSSPQTATSPTPPRRLLPGEESTSKSKPTSPLPPRLPARRRSLGSLPDVSSPGIADDSRTKRRNSLVSAGSDPTLSRNQAAQRSTTRQDSTKQTNTRWR